MREHHSVQVLQASLDETEKSIAYLDGKIVEWRNEIDHARNQISAYQAKSAELKEALKFMKAYTEAQK